MGTKNNPGKFDCYENADPDEPMFILLARDPQAPALVRAWAYDRNVFDTQGKDKQKILEALDCADAMDEWREANR